MKPSAGVALIVLLAAAPLLLPVAAFSPSLLFVRQVTLQLTYDSAGAECEERSVRLPGFEQVRRYGPIESASDDLLPVVTAPGEPGRTETISTLALRTRAGVYYPMRSMNRSGQMSAEIRQFIQHPTSESLVLVKSQQYPLGFVIFDAIGLMLAVLIARFWTVPLCLAAWRKLNGAAPTDVAQPFIRILGRAGNLATWASRR